MTPAGPPPAASRAANWWGGWPLQPDRRGRGATHPERLRLLRARRSPAVTPVTSEPAGRGHEGCDAYGLASSGVGQVGRRGYSACMGYRRIQWRGCEERDLLP